MTAPFAVHLCGFRVSGSPSTSDNNDKGSVEWGHALFDALGVADFAVEVADIGSKLEALAIEQLAALRPDLVIAGSQQARQFAQYRHLGVFSNFLRRYKGDSDSLSKVIELIGALPPTRESKNALRRLGTIQQESSINQQLVTELTETMPEESLLKVDITVASPSPANRLLVAISSKWSLRTDRAQDCVSQGSKLVSLRRGHMPHYAVLTMEPRPAMLKLIAYGSGSVDCVYHVALPELRIAAEQLERRRGPKPWPQRILLERMVTQGRIRAYQDLVDEIMRLPTEW